MTNAYLSSNSNNVRISFSIMAHPDRKEMVDDLLSAFKGYAVSIAWAKPDEGQTTRENSNIAWNYFNRGATHHLVLQDDVQLCKHFLSALPKVVAQKPKAPLALYSGRKQACETLKKNKRWIATNWIWGQAIILPTKDIPLLLGWQKRYVKTDYPSSDFSISAFYEFQRRRAFLPVPLLVQHCQSKSLMGHTGGIANIGKCFADDLGVDVRTIDWTLGSETPDSVFPNKVEDYLGLFKDVFFRDYGIQKPEKMQGYRIQNQRGN